MELSGLRFLLLLDIACCTIADLPGFSASSMSSFGTPSMTSSRKSPVEYMDPPPPFPFLEELGYSEIQEFQKIFQNTALSGFQWNGQLLNWAEKNNVTEPFLLFKNRLENDRRRAEVNLLKCLDELRQFFYEYQRIGNNLVYTWEQANDLRQELMKKLTRKQMRVATMLGNLYTPRDVPTSLEDENPYMQEPFSPFGPRRGCGRPRQGPFGQYPFGQPMNFGQGPWAGQGGE